ncbi:MAG: glycosyltransferase family 9 protein [Syntrophobacterales bacterium]|nr:MAG: glycosyltransferase family 9 protein [Syntrophobacterales bacterium]
MEGLKPAKILIVHQGGVGDFILCLPAFGSIRQHYPGSRIELMGYPRILQLVEGRYYVDQGKSIDQVGLGPFYLEDGKLGGRVFGYFADFDLAFLFFHDRNIIFSDNVRRTGIKRVFTISPFPEKGRRVHVIDHMLSFLSWMGIPPGESIPRIFLLEEDRWFAEVWLRQRGAFDGMRKGLVAFHPGSGSQKKLWPIENFLDLAERITRDLRLNTILLSGPAEREYLGSGLERMRAIIPIWAEDLPLIHVASILDKCRYYIGNDSGITHLAAAVGIPTIALFGPTDPEIWGPRGERVAILEKHLGCSPCTQEELEGCNQQRCLELIEVEEVIERAKSLM